MHYSRYFYRDSFFLDMRNFGELFAKKNKRQQDALDAFTKIGSNLSNSSLRKQPTFRDNTIGFPAKWCLTNELRNSMLMMRYYLDLFGWKFASTNQKHYSHLGSDASSVWKLCARFSDVISCGKQWWLREISAVFSGYSNSSKNRQSAKPRKWNVTHRFSLHVTDQVLFSVICVCAKCHPSTRGGSRKIVWLLIFKLPAEEHVSLGKFKCHEHGWADDAITRQNLIKILP